MQWCGSASNNNCSKDKSETANDPNNQQYETTSEQPIKLKEMNKEDTNAN
jgi:hypothetical protein